MTSPKKHSCTADNETYCAEASTGSCYLLNCRKKFPCKPFVIRNAIGQNRLIGCILETHRSNQFD